MNIENSFSLKASKRYYYFIKLNIDIFSCQIATSKPSSVQEVIIFELWLKCTFNQERRWKIIKQIHYFTAVLCAMRRYGPYQYSWPLFGVRGVYYTHPHEVPQRWPSAILMLWIGNERITALSCYVSYKRMNIYWQEPAIAPSAAAIILFNGHATYNEGNFAASLSSWYILTADQNCFAWKCPTGHPY